MVFRKKLAAAVCAAFAALTLTAVPASAAGGQTLLLGDSVFANPTYAQVGSTLPQTFPSINDTVSQPGSPSPQGCPQGAKTVATELQRMTGSRVVNYACSGTAAASPSTRFSFQAQVDHAISTGTVAGSRNIVIMVGLNDTRKGANPWTVGPALTAAVTREVNKIKRANPHAIITLSSYPALSGRFGQLCPVRTIPGNGTPGIPLEWFYIHTAEDTAGSSLYKASRNTGTRFYNLQGLTYNNGMCAPNGSRWIAGSVENIKFHNYANHLTHQGVAGVAGLLARDVIGSYDDDRDPDALYRQHLAQTLADEGLLAPDNHTERK